MHIKLLSRFFEMAHRKSEMLAWVQGQVNNMVENYILLHIAKHRPAYDTMPGNISHWENELATAMGIIVGTESSCSRSAIIKGVRHLLIDLEELDHNADVIRRKTWRKMKKEHIDQGSVGYKEAVDSFMNSINNIAILIAGTEPEAIDTFVSAI